MERLKRVSGGSCMEGSKAWESVEPGAGGLASGRRRWIPRGGKGYHQSTSRTELPLARSVQARKSRNRDDTGSVRSRTRMDFDRRVTGSRNQAMPGQFLRYCPLRGPTGD
jgi:hypothetical protein